MGFNDVNSYKHLLCAKHSIKYIKCSIIFNFHHNLKR